MVYLTNLINLISFCYHNIVLFLLIGILSRLTEADQCDMQKQGYEYIRFEMIIIAEDNNH